MEIVNDETFECLYGIDNNSAQSDEIDELKRKLYFDAVLSCQNRTKFEEDTKDLKKPYTYFTLDANNLKFCNDKFSHEAGDTLLKVTAEIGIKVWSIDNFYRVGGDEFAVLISGVAQDDFISSEQLTQFKQLIAEKDSNYEFPIAVSVGFATSNDADTLDEVIKLADSLMYEDKRIYKEANPEYDLRKARFTSDTLKDALKSGDFSKAYKELRANQDKKESDKEVTLVENDYTFSGVADSPEPLYEKPNSHDLTVIKQEDLSGVVTSDDESTYEANELSKKIQPVLKETTEKAVKDAVKFHNDKLKLEVAEVLDDEVSYRLNKYEKRRRRRDFKEKINSITKGVVILLVILFILGNQQLRLRFALVFQDIGDMITSLIKGEETSSNKLVEDLFRDLGEDLNEVNSVEVEGFNINN